MSQLSHEVAKVLEFQLQHQRNLEIDGETVDTVSDFILLGSKITAMVTAAMKLKDACPWKESYDQPR